MLYTCNFSIAVFHTLQYLLAGLFTQACQILLNEQFNRCERLFYEFLLLCQQIATGENQGMDRLRAALATIMQPYQSSVLCLLSQAGHPSVDKGLIAFSSLLPQGPWPVAVEDLSPKPSSDVVQIQRTPPHKLITKRSWTCTCLSPGPPLLKSNLPHGKNTAVAGRLWNLPLTPVLLVFHPMAKKAGEGIVMQMPALWLL